MPARIYKIAKPLETHTRAATCDEVACDAQQHGFAVLADEATTLGQAQAHYFRNRYDLHQRAFIETKVASLTTFSFPSGQQCFAEHRVSLDRPEFYAVADLGQVKRHTGPDPWLNDCGTHLDKIRKVIG